MWNFNISIEPSLHFAIITLKFRRTCFFFIWSFILVINPVFIPQVSHFNPASMLPLVFIQTALNCRLFSTLITSPAFGILSIKLSVQSRVWDLSQVVLVPKSKILSVQTYQPYPRATPNSLNECYLASGRDFRPNTASSVRSTSNTGTPRNTRNLLCSLQPTSCRVLCI